MNASQTLFKFNQYFFPKNKGVFLAEVININKDLFKVYKQQAQALESKMYKIYPTTFDRSCPQINHCAKKIYSVFSQLNHQILRLNYLDHKSQNLELDEIANTLSKLEGLIDRLEDIIYEKMSIKEIVKALG